MKIEIADASGKVVRTLEAPAKMGLNRTVWNFGRDAGRQPPNDNHGFPRSDESGPELRKTLADFNRLFAEDVVEFRRKVGEAGVGLLQEEGMISIE